MSCPPVVTFDPTAWYEAFPTFANIGDPLANQCFTSATFMCANQADNPLNGVTGMLQQALWLLTAHVAWLTCPRDAQGNPAASGSPPPPIVGRINSAHEGSVSVGADVGDINAGSPSQAYYMQTQWGALYWAMTAGIRTARYAGSPYPPPAGPAYFGRGGRILYGRGRW